MKRSDVNTLRYALTLVAAVLTGVGLAAAVNAVAADNNGDTADLDAVIRHDLELAPGALLRIMNANGRIVVSSWDQDRVAVTIAKRVTFLPEEEGWFSTWRNGPAGLDESGREALAALEPDIRTDDDAVEISSLQASPRNDVSIAYHYDIKIPRGRRLAVATANGPVRISGVEGDVSAASENGDVECDTVRGNLAARARNGSVYLRHIAGALRAEAMNGPIRVDSRAVTGLHSLQCTSENGPIRVHLPRDAEFYLRASAVNGHVAAGFPVNGDKPAGPLHDLEGPIGAGGPEVALKCLNGSVYLTAS